MPRSASSSIRLLIVVTAICFLLELGAGDTAIITFALWPLQSGFMPWQLITYAFVHANFTHIAFNMLGLWMFGRSLEYAWGSRAILEIYFASVLSAGLTQLLVTIVTGGVYPTLGASGGVFGLLLGYGMCFPRRTVMLLIPPIPMPAWLFVTLYAVIELVLGVTGTQAGVAHFAHLGGMIGAYLVIRLQQGKRRQY
jgi:membrane associated rhomboid family serine protease